MIGIQFQSWTAQYIRVNCIDATQTLSIYLPDQTYTKPVLESFTNSSVSIYLSHSTT